MIKQKINSSGFHTVGLVFVLLFVAVAGASGLRIFHLKDNSKAEGQAVAVKSQTPTIPPSPIPAGWQMFTDGNIGVQFVYPNAFGAFTSQRTILSSFPDYESLDISAIPSNSGIIGVHGGFTLITYKKGHDIIASRKYGPKIQLTDNGWVIVEPNPYNPLNYKPGDSYDEMTSSNTHGLQVYTDKSADEGTFSYSMYFVTHDRLHQLQLPTFDSGAYSSNNINDQSAYDAMYATVRDSIGLY